MSTRFLLCLCLALPLVAQDTEALIDQSRLLLEQLEQEPDDPALRARLRALLEELATERRRVRGTVGSGGALLDWRSFSTEEEIELMVHPPHAADFTVLLGESPTATPVSEPPLTADRVQLVGGDALHGEVIAFSASGVELTHTALGALEVATPEVATIRFRPRAESAASARTQAVVLRSGERIAGAPGPFAQGQLEWYAGFSDEPLRFPADALARIELATVPPDAGERVVFLNGDRFRGELRAISQGHARIGAPFAEGELEVPLPELVSVGFAAPSVHSAPPYLELRDGSRLCGQWLELSAEQLAWQSPWEGELAVSLAQVDRVVLHEAPVTSTITFVPTGDVHRTASTPRYDRRVGYDVLYLADGDRLSGTIAGSGARSITLETAYGRLAIDRGAVEALTFAAAPPPQNAFLGVRLAPDSARVRVLEVIVDGPAERAGLRGDDVIIRYGEKPVHDRGALSTMLSGSAPGERIEIFVERRGNVLQVPVVLGERQTSSGRILAPPAPPVPAPVAPPAPAFVELRRVRGLYDGLAGERIVLIPGENVPASSPYRELYLLSPRAPAELVERLQSWPRESFVQLELDGDGKVIDVE